MEKFCRTGIGFSRRSIKRSTYKEAQNYSYTIETRFSYHYLQQKMVGDNQDIKTGLNCTSTIWMFLISETINIPVVVSTERIKS